jgi:hypothetical protein
MFEKPRYIQNSFKIAFQSQVEIQSKTDEFEYILKDYYNRFMPDESKPDLRHSWKGLVFISKHGFSKIIISQRKITLNVSYSKAYQNDFQKGKQYILERMPLLFELLNVIDRMKPRSYGLVTQVRISSNANINAMIYHVHHLFLKNTSSADLSEIQLKMTNVISDQFLSSITLKNYRIDKFQREIQSYSNANAVKWGIAIDGDYRYVFSRQGKYLLDLELANKIVDCGFAQINKMIVPFFKLEISEEQRRELIHTTKGKYKSILSSTEEFIERKRQEIQVEG